MHKCFRGIAILQEDSFMKKYDMIIVGSGSGLMVMEAALNAGLSCAVVEKSKFGGTCLTKGCIPSKMLVYPADLLREASDAKRIGLTFTPPETDWDLVAHRMWKQINQSEQIRESLLKTEGLDVYQGTAAFTGEHTMIITYEDGRPAEELDAGRIVIAAGARSSVPPVPGLEDTGYITSETFFGERFPARPWKSLIIIGGGAIGAEFAHIFSSFGTKVTVVEMKPHIIPTEEEEISLFVEKQFRNNGITVNSNTKIISASRSGTEKAMSVEDMSTGEKKTIKAEEIFVASGVRSNGDLLHLPKAGVKTDSRGYIETDQYLQTSKRHIYAIGDINGKYQLRHKANYEAGILIDNLFGQGEMKQAKYDATPWAIFTWPQVGHVGLTERQAKEKGLRVWVGRNFYSDIAGGIAMGYSRHGEDNGFVKIIAGEDQKILGVHAVGPYAAILVQPFVYLMNAGYQCECVSDGEGVKPSLGGLIRSVCPQIGTFLPLNDSMVIHPSMSELAAWALEGIDWSREQ
jgi:dihydrolipoamide dehydrogenase